jgi:serine/threonine protein kinase
VASAVPHPHLVRCLAFEEREGTPYLVFEYLGGESLAERISRAGRWTETEAVRILTQVAEAVQAIHDHGVVHGDLKATNILIADDGQAKLMGLGQVRLDDAELGLPNPRTMLNALNFVAPEQFEDGRAVTPRGDIYALGAALYLAVTGDLPFRANGALGTLRRKLNNDFVAARQLVATLSGRTDGAIRRALSMDPVERPASCREWIAELTEGPLCVSCAGQQ